MKDRWLAYIPALLLAALAALTYWLDQQVHPLNPPRDSAGNSPDFLVEDLVASRMKLDGTPRYAVRAKRLVHYPGDNRAVLEDPYVTHFDPERAPVTVRAKHGEVSNNGENVYLRGNVEVRRHAYADQEEVSLQTSYLHVIPDRDLAETDRPVILTRGDSVVKAIGLEFNHATHSLKLLSQVRGTFETPAKRDRPLMPWEHRR